MRQRSDAAGGDRRTRTAAGHAGQHAEVYDSEGSTVGLAVRAGGIHTRWLLYRMSIVTPVVLGVGVLALSLYGHSLGPDFRDGMWKAGKAVLAGRSPNPPASVHALLLNRYAFIPPPPFAWLAVPFAMLPFPLAVALWDIISLGAFAGALRLVGARDWRLCLAVFSLPFISTLGFGQTEGVLALGLAIAWRWRNSAAGAVAVGALIAAKLLVWPLVIWLVLTRRLRLAMISVGSAIMLLLLSWAPIGFRGAFSYPALLVADARSLVGRTHSVTSLLTRIGVSGGMAQLLAVAFAGLVALVILSRSRHSELRGFLAAIACALLCSPLLEMHYLTLLFIPLAIARPRLDTLWLFTIDVFWLSPQDPARAIWQIALVLASMTFILVRAEPQEQARPVSTTYSRLAG